MVVGGCSALFPISITVHSKCQSQMRLMLQLTQSGKSLFGKMWRAVVGCTDCHNRYSKTNLFPSRKFRNCILVWFSTNVFYLGNLLLWNLRIKVALVRAAVLPWLYPNHDWRVYNYEWILNTTKSSPAHLPDLAHCLSSIPDFPLFTPQWNLSYMHCEARGGFYDLQPQKKYKTRWFGRKLY